MVIRVICHNVYWFQGHPFSGCSPDAPEPEVLRRLCDLYREQGATVLCLQEIQSEATAESVAAEMQMSTHYVPGRVYSQYGCLIASALGPATLLPEGSVQERSLVAARIPLPTGELGVASVHLTSGRQTSAAEAKAARLREMEELLAMHGAEIDLLTGDFNEDPEDGVGDLLRSHGFVDVAPHFGKEAVGSLLSGTRRRDLIWIKAGWQSRVLDYGVVGDELAVDDLAGKSFLSDHRPLWIALKVD